MSVHVPICVCPNLYTSQSVHVPISSQSTRVATLDGGVLGSARIPKDLLQEEALETTTALLVSLFTEHSSLSLNFRTFIIDCENSKAVVGGLGALVLSVWGESNSTSGALMAKVSHLDYVLKCSPCIYHCRIHK